MGLVRGKLGVVVLVSLVVPLAGTVSDVAAKSGGGSNVPEPAEYALRWDIGAGGPRTAADVLKLLGQAEGAMKINKVTYYQVPRLAEVPKGFEPILRLRAITDGKKELTYKLRGEAPLPHYSKSWSCPLPRGNEPRQEVDISFIDPEDFKRAFSISCDTKIKGPLKPVLDSLHVDKRGCSASMQRVKQNSYTVEAWTLGTGRELIELSMKGEDAPDSHLQFRQTVNTLVKAGIQPLPDGITETVMRSCN